MSVHGTKNLLMREHDNMDASGLLHPPPHVCTFSKPAHGLPPWHMDPNSPTIGGAPSTPPIMESDWTRQCGKAKKEVSYSFPTAIHVLKEIDRVPIQKVENDSKFVALYINFMGRVIKTMMLYGFPYLPQQELHVYEQEEKNSIEVWDEWVNKYCGVEGNALHSFTKNIVPIFLSKMYAPLDFTKPTMMAMARPKDSGYGVSTPWYWGATAPSAGKPPMRTEPGLGEPTRDSTPMGFGHRDWSSLEMGELGGFPIDEGPSKPTDHGKFPKEKTWGEKEEHKGKNIFPTTLQKLCKKFDGIGDPHKHIAQFNQLIQAEGVTDVHTKVHGFGLTLSSSALSWFQTLRPTYYMILMS